jgi:hypothetical protein
LATIPESCEPTQIIDWVLESVEGSTKPVPATTAPKGLVDGVTGGGKDGAGR